MPLHDWTRVPSGLFHHFHQDWTIEIARTLNRGRLPKGVAALVEQGAGPKEPDVLAIESRRQQTRSGSETGGAVAMLTPPVTRIVRRSSKEIYSGRANRIVLKHHLGRIIAVIEILSPGNKDSRAALRDFIDKTIDLLRTGIHVLVVDLFPPTPRVRAASTRSSGMRFWRKTLSFPTGKIESWPHTRRAEKRRPTSSRYPSATRCRICRCSWATICTFRFPWNRRTRQLGKPARKNFAWRSRPASCPNPRQSRSALSPPYY